jgi:nicotinate dehydrogenase subunit B
MRKGADGREVPEGGINSAVPGGTGGLDTREVRDGGMNSAVPGGPAGLDEREVPGGGMNSAVPGGLGGLDGWEVPEGGMNSAVPGGLGGLDTREVRDGGMNSAVPGGPEGLDGREVPEGGMNSAVPGVPGVPGWELSRRKLLQVLGGGILVLASAPDAWAETWAAQGQEIPQEIGAWIHISPQGKITVFTGKVEVGQNARTSITAAAAEELRVSPASITVLMGDTDLVPFDMGTFGSRTTPTMIPQVRRAAAAAREAMIALAIKKWNVQPTSIIAENGRVSAGSLSETYGQLASGHVFDQEISQDIVLTSPLKWKVLGTVLPKIDAQDIVTGRHEYTSDMHRAGMLHAKVLRPRTFGATISTIDTSKAAALPNVKVVRDGEFVAVAAPTLRQAQVALEAIEVEWHETAQPSSKNLISLLKTTDPPSVATGAKTLAGSYTAAYIAHVPLEPRAALAEWDGKKMTIHTGSQRPFGVRDEVMKALGLTDKQVRVIVPDTGSGYGGKHSGDAAVEAARVAKALGVPIRLVWTRREEMTFAYFRPGGVIEISSGLGNDGKLTDWTHDNYNSGPSAIGTPYEVAKKRTQYHQAESPLRQGSYRGLAATFNNFARETHMDELAHMVGQDPMDFRLANMTNARLKAVLEAAGARFRWGRSKPDAGHGYGLACGTEKDGYIATIVEVAVDGKKVQVVRAVTAFECGAILNPDQLRNQVEGALIMGLGGALFEAIEFDNGRILTDRLAKYRVPRYKDVPSIQTVLLDRKDLPSAGAGETPIIAIAPAIGNAIFNATGIRLRSLPLTLP